MSHREIESEIIYEQRDERGSLSFEAFRLGGLAVKRTMQATGFGWAVPTWFKAGAVAGIVAGIGFAGSAIEHGVGVETSADIRKGETTSESELLALNTEARLQVADAYFGTTFQAREVDQIIKGKFGPLSKDWSFDYNTELTGVGNFTFTLPFEAVTTSKGVNGSTDFSVAADQVGVKYGWIPGSPVFRDFTVKSDGTPDFEDRKGGWEGLIGKVTSDLQAVNIDGPANKMADLRKKTQHDIELAALESMAKTCPVELSDEIYKAIENAIEVNVDSMQQDGEVGEIEFTGALKFGKIEPPQKAQEFSEGVLKTGYNYGDPHVDKQVCSTDMSKVQVTQ